MCHQGAEEDVRVGGPDLGKGEHIVVTSYII